MVGIEPTTYGLRNRCSTTELHWLKAVWGGYFTTRGASSLGSHLLWGWVPRVISGGRRSAERATWLG